MVARGDLGIEMVKTKLEFSERGVEKVYHKAVIMATQMMNL